MCILCLPMDVLILIMDKLDVIGKFIILIVSISFFSSRFILNVLYFFFQIFF